MSKRVTIVIDDDNDKFVHQQQARTIKESNSAYSYSRCVNDLLRGIRK